MKKNYKVIIIESEVRNLEHLIDTCNNYKCNIDKAINSIDAVQKIVSNDYDYYFINIDNDGYYLIDLINNSKNSGKIVVMTSNSTCEEEREIRSFGITYLLKTPFSENEIKNLLLH